MYAIIGATGHTGNVVAKRLLHEGQRVRAIGRNQERLQPLMDLGAESFVCGLTNTGDLSKAFAGVSAAYVMIPADMASQNLRASQDRTTGSIASALAKAGVEFVVTLSSIGADKAHNTGPVVGLHNLEKAINVVKGLNVVHLRPGYFMENTLAQAHFIRTMGYAAGPLLPNLEVPMIATRDIGEFAAELLLHLDFKGQQTHELHGQRDLNMTEAARSIGQAIGNPELTYVRLSDDEFREAITHLGMSTNTADLILEMAVAMNSGHMRALEPRSADNTTPTSYESFVAEEFVPTFESSMAHA